MSKKEDKLISLLKLVDKDYLLAFFRIGSILLEDKNNVTLLVEDSEIEHEETAEILSRLGEFISDHSCDYDSPEVSSQFDDFMGLCGEEKKEVYLEHKNKPINALMDDVSLGAFGLGTLLYSQSEGVRLTYAELIDSSPDKAKTLDGFLEELIKKRWVLFFMDGELKRYYFNHNMLGSGDENDT